MKEILDLMQCYGTNMFLAVLCIQVYISLNKERKELMNTLNERTEVFTQTITDMVSKMSSIDDRLKDIEEKIEK